MATVLILGATSDIAIAIARKFASEKYNLQLAARNINDLVELRLDVQVRYGINCTNHSFDALNFTEHQAFYESLIPRPDIAVYVSGFMTDNELAFNDWSLAKRTLETNFTGAVSIINIIAHDFSKRKAGSIAGISSVAGMRGRQSNFIYGSAKSGFTTYLSGLRNYMYFNNVHVLTVLPGFVDTKMTSHLKLPAMLTAQPDEVAEKVYQGIIYKKNVVYVKWFWRWIMQIIIMVPETIFKKKKL